MKINGCVHLLDAPEVIMKKFKRAVTDSEAKGSAAEANTGYGQFTASYRSFI